jgi:hypothetical protein
VLPKFPDSSAYFDIMPLTRDFKETIMADFRRDLAYRVACCVAVSSFLGRFAQVSSAAIVARHVLNSLPAPFAKPIVAVYGPPVPSSEDADMEVGFVRTSLAPFRSQRCVST